MTLDLDEVEKACAAARPGPWKAGDSHGLYVAPVSPPDADCVALLESEAGWEGRYEDAAFIAGARSWVPELVGEVRRLRAENAQLLEKAAKVAEDTECAGISREWAAAQKAIAAAIRALGAK